MSDTKPTDVTQWLHQEATRNSQLRSEKTDSGEWKHSARRRSTFYRRSYMLNQAAKLIESDQDGQN